MKRKPKELHPHSERPEFVNVFRDFWHGKPPELVGEKAITGALKPPIKSKITRRIKGIEKTAINMKIGVMGDTKVRMDDKKYRTKFDFVERIYKTANKQAIIDYEVELIKKFKELYPGDKLLNASTNRASRLTTYNGFYYIYVVYNV